jgi:hypothetical protein
MYKTILVPITLRKVYKVGKSQLIVRSESLLSAFREKTTIIYL